MSTSRVGALLRLYPPSWRARYGDELEDLLLQNSGGGRVPWRMRADVVRSAARERLRAAGLQGDGSPASRMLGGVLLALAAWAAFVLAGLVVQKVSEHWKDAAPVAHRGLPAAAFDVLIAAAIVGSMLVLVGIAAALPALASLLRAGGWPSLRRHFLAALLITTVELAATGVLVLWAHGLTSVERNGGDAAYAVAFVAWAVGAAATLMAWTAVAVTTARRLRLSPSTLALEARVASGVAFAMAVMTAATITWWLALADVAPWFFAGRPAGASGPQVAVEPLLASCTMAGASAIALVGAFRAVRARADAAGV